MASLYEYVPNEPSGRLSLSDAEFNVTYILQETIDEDGVGQGDHPTVEDLYVNMNALLGYTITDKPAAGGNGGMQRVPPASHPLAFNMFAVDVGFRPVKGSLFDKEEGDESLEAPPLVAGFCQYHNYLLDVKYQTLPFGRPRPDEMILNLSRTYYDEDGELQTLLYADEFNRYTRFSPRPTPPQLVTATAGEMRFRAPGNSAIDNSQFAAIPTHVLPDTIVSCIWYGVPMRYVTSRNSYLYRYRGYINQGDFLEYASGCLLYKDFNIIREFQPPLAEYDQDIPGTFKVERLCDLELLFMYTTRQAEEVPVATDIRNVNWLPQGWNLQPHYTDRLYYYVTSQPANPNLSEDEQKDYWRPQWLSAPFEILYKDPDA